MGWITKREADRGVSPAECKICALCGALNHSGNGECFTCGWHGAFVRDADAVAQAWRLLESVHGQVHLEHLTGRRPARITDLIAVEPAAPKRPGRWSAWWRALLGRRPSRSAPEGLLPPAPPHHRPIPPNGLGV